MKYKKFDRPVQKENETHQKFRQRLISWALNERERALYLYLQLLEIKLDMLSEEAENER